MKTRVILGLAVVCTFVAGPPLFAQSTYYVDAGAHGPGNGSPGNPFINIQSAFLSSRVENGDTLLVRDGLYFGTINPMGKEVILVSENGPANAILDGAGTGRVFRIVFGEGPGLVIQGFTIQNGMPPPGAVDGPVGGGILARNSSPTIRDNLITACQGDGAGIYLWNSDSLVEGNAVVANGNQAVGGGCDPGLTATLVGAGIGVRGGAPVIQNNVVSGNCGVLVGSGSRGGGIALGDGSAALVQDNLIAGNVAELGGGISVDATQVVISGNTVEWNQAVFGGGIRDTRGSLIEDNLIQDNTASSAGGIVVAFDEEPNPGAVVIGNTIQRNSTTSTFSKDGGGGIAFRVTPGLFLNNRVLNNHSALDGGGFYCFRCVGVTAAGNLFAGNTAVDFGGGIFMNDNSQMDIGTSTFVQNSAREGGAIYLDDVNVIVRISSCLLWDNTALIQGPEIRVNPNSLPTLRYCDIQGASGESWFGEGCIDTDPLLLGGGHIRSWSPCAESGDPDYTPLAGELDLDEGPRISGGRIDIGLDEVQWDLRFLQSAAIAGQFVTMIATNALPGERVYFCFGTAGIGPGITPSKLGNVVTFDLLGLIQVAGFGTANANGRATRQFGIPAGAAGLAVYTQAVIRRGAGGSESVKSNWVATVVE